MAAKLKQMDDQVSEVMGEKLAAAVTNSSWDQWVCLLPAEGPSLHRLSVALLSSAQLSSPFRHSAAKHFVGCSASVTSVTSGGAPPPPLTCPLLLWPCRTAGDSSRPWRGMPRDTLLLVLSDHGQTLGGDHGGGSPDETDSVLLAVNLAALTRRTAGPELTAAHQPTLT